MPFYSKVSTKSLQCPTLSSPHLKACISQLRKQGKWNEIVKYCSRNEILLEELEETGLDPIPSTLGCLAIAVLYNASAEEANKIHSYIKGILALLVENLRSKDLTLVYYSYRLLDSCAVYFTESTVHELINYNIFEAFSNIITENTILFSHKLFKSREKAQRVFLKNNGYVVLLFCLKKFGNCTKEILEAGRDLLIV